MEISIKDNPTAPIVVIDTDIFSYWFKGDTRGEPYRQYIKGYKMALSFATVGELYYWAFKYKWGAARLNLLERIMFSCLILPYDDINIICQKFAMARVQPIKGEHFEPISYDDYWTAACALKYDCPVITNNVEHFSRIKGIKLLGPYSN